MPTAWLTLLRKVPWRDVIENAPVVVNGARRLWSAVEKRKTPPEEIESSAALEARAGALEKSVSELHKEMLASSELINSLAEQNAQLIQRMEAIRVRMLWLGAAVGVAALAAALALALLLIHRA